MSGSLIVGPYDLLSSTSPVQLSNDTTTDLGSGIPDVTTVSRLLLDGDIVSGVRTANRSVVLDVFLDPTLTPGQVGTVMANLLAAVDQPLWQMSWTPDSASPTVVFDCQRGQVARGYNGGIYASATLTIPASPFTRDPLPTVLAPPTSGVGAGVLDALATTTGLTGAPAYTFSYPGDATMSGITGYSGSPGAATVAADSTFAPPGSSVSVKQTTNAVGEQYAYTTYYTHYNPDGTTDQAPLGTTYVNISNFYFRWARSFTSTDLTDTAQIGVYTATDLNDINTAPHLSNNAGKWGGGSDVTSASYGDWRLTLYSAAGSATWVINNATGSLGGTPDKSWQRVIWQVGAAPLTTSGTFAVTAVTGYRIEHWALTNNQDDTGKSIWLSALTAIASAGGIQLSGPYGLVQFDGVLGAARTPVSVQLSSPTALSTLLIARTPNPPAGYNPILTGGTGGSGTSNTPTGRFSATVYSHETWTRPALALSGTYAVLARVYRNSSSGDTITVTAELGTDTASTQTASRVFSATDPSAPATSTFGWVTVGTLTLPPRRVDPANTAATITFAYNSPAGAFLVDIMVLVDLAGDQILVQLPSGTTLSQFFIDAPGPTDQRGKVSGGSLSDRSDAVDLTQWSTGLLTNFDPGANTITVVADNATTGAQAQVSYYPRWPGERPQ